MDVAGVAGHPVEVAVDVRADAGGGPHWDASTMSLWFVDLIMGTVFRYDRRSGRPGERGLVRRAERFGGDLMVIGTRDVDEIRAPADQASSTLGRDVNATVRRALLR